MMAASVISSVNNTAAIAHPCARQCYFIREIKGRLELTPDGP